MARKTITILMFLSIFGLFGCREEKKGSRDSHLSDEITTSIKDFSNRPIHRQLTKEILDSTANKQLEQLIFDNISQIIGNDDDSESKSLQKLTRGQQAVYATWMVEAEVNNGGFNQFYFNTGGLFSNMAVEGFKTFGAEKFADLMIEANGVYETIKGDLKKSDDGTIDSFSESYEDNPLNDLDTRFYDLYKEEPLSDLKIKYIRENIDEFIKDTLTHNKRSL